MKNKKRVQTIIFGLIMFIGQLMAQDTIQKDPLMNFKNFYEVGISINGTRVNTNYTQFNTSNGSFNFKKNNYIPSTSGSIHYGWLLKLKIDEETSTLFTIKTGLDIINKNANLLDSIGNDLRLSTSYVQIPMLFGFRMPLEYRTVKNNLFRAIELNAGVYVASPIFQKLDHPDNLDSELKSLEFNYFRFGFLGEIVFTALNNKGQGHKFGIRASNDFTDILKVKKTETELYPYYYTIALFYNILNNYK